MMARIFPVLVVGLAVFCVGCATTQDVGSDYDPVVRFPELKTFSWQQPADDGRVNEIVENRVKAAVVAQLTAKGYEELIARWERPVLAAAMARFGGNQARLAAALNMHRTTLRKKLRAYGLVDAGES